MATPMTLNAKLISMFDLRCFLASWKISYVASTSLENLLIACWQKSNSHNCTNCQSNLKRNSLHEIDLISHYITITIKK